VSACLDLHPTILGSVGRENLVRARRDHEAESPIPWHRVRNFDHFYGDDPIGAFDFYRNGRRRRRRRRWSDDRSRTAFTDAPGNQAHSGGGGRRQLKQGCTGDAREDQKSRTNLAYDVTRECAHRFILTARECWIDFATPAQFQSSARTKKFSFAHESPVSPWQGANRHLWSSA